MPGGRQQPGLRLAVTDHAGDQQAGVVQRRAVGVRERVSELAAFVDRARRLGGDMAGYTAGGELPEQRRHTGGVAGDVRVGVGVAAVQPGVGEDGGAAVARAPHADGVQIPLFHGTVEVRVHQVEAR